MHNNSQIAEYMKKIDYADGTNKKIVKPLYMSHCKKKKQRETKTH